MMVGSSSVSRSSSQRQPQQFVDRGVVQAFALRDLAPTADHTIVEQLLPVEGPRQRHQQGLVDLAGDLARRLDRPIRPHYHLAAATLADLQRDECRQLDLAATRAGSSERRRSARSCWQYPGSCAISLE